MWDYIVLGQVPGTQIQVSFETWLFGMAGVATLYLVSSSFRVYKTHRRSLQRRIRRASQMAAYLEWLLTPPQHHA